MKRTIIAGISLLILSALAAPTVKAETRVERQIGLTHPNRIASSQTVQPSVQSKINPVNEQARKSDSEAQKKLSERDRIIQEYQTQTVIPVQ